MSEISSNDHNLVAQLAEIAGIDKDLAADLLRENAYDLNRAANFLFERNASDDNAETVAEAAADSNAETSTQGGMPPRSNLSRHRFSPYNTNNATNTDDENVRAPIAPRREQLLLPEEDNFRTRRRRAPSFTICPLRNFAREAEMQEEALNNYSIDRNFWHVPRRRPPLRPRLEDLFCPPVDLLFSGSFQAARTHAKNLNRFLLANLQDNSDFNSQALNRDVWKDETVKAIVSENFVLWQVSIDNAEGLRFQCFYKVTNIPFVAVIDPQTGEALATIEQRTAAKFAQRLKDFLESRSTDSDETDLRNEAGPSTSTTSIRSSTVTTNSSNSKEFNLSELTEEEQLNLAIKNSLMHTTSNDVDQDFEEWSDNPDLPPQSSNDSTSEPLPSTSRSYIAFENNDTVSHDSDKNPQNEENSENLETYEKFLGTSNDPITRIQLRFPNGDRLSLEWPNTSKLRALKLYIDSKKPDFTKKPYKILTSFPQQNILELDNNMTLMEAKLHPTAILHIRVED